MTVTGGELVADALVAHGVRHLFTLCGGHIAPILVAAKARGIRVIDTRDERSAAFAADAVSRLTGVPGVAAVTAGPGVTNTITAIKNAQLAQSPLVLLGGATGTILEGRGSLQDIDQHALLAPHVKYLARVRRVRDLVPAVHRAFAEARSGVPGPTFVECPVDLLYEESVVRKLYGVGGGEGDAKPARGLGARLLQGYLNHHLNGLFRGAAGAPRAQPAPVLRPTLDHRSVRRVARALAAATRPVLLVGSQAMLEAAGNASMVAALAKAVGGLGMPVYLSGMARGLLGADHPNQRRHQRRKALAEADLVLLAGVPCDFRLDYGRHISARATVVSINLSGEDLKKNRRPQIGLRAAPGSFLVQLAHVQPAAQRRARARGVDPWFDWRARLAERDAEREADIDRRAEIEGDRVNPLAFFRALDPLLDDNSVLVADGGDFVATASYTLRPRGPLRWLDPGVFGTLGVGGGFAVGAQAVRADSEVWLIWGDGSSAFSLAELDT
jgi:acetolactate synthase-1/2/3 large subunit